MDIMETYNLIIEASVIIILSFLFSEISKKTNIPSVLLLIALGVILKVILDQFGYQLPDLMKLLTLLGTLGLIMIVLEAALELKLERDKYIPIAKSLFIAFVGLMLSIWVAAIILKEMVPGMTNQLAWIYATPLSILSSAIIIPSVESLKPAKREFHIYESTFSDILGIIVFYFLLNQAGFSEHAPVDAAHAHDGHHASEGGGIIAYSLNNLLTMLASLVASYIIVLVFQRIKTHVKLFLLIAVLLLLYAVGKKLHLSSLIIILVFGLMIANLKLFFRGPLRKWLHLDKVQNLYEGLHVVTMETAFVVRTFFFVIFGLTISLTSLFSIQVAMISLLIVVSIYLIRLLILLIFVGRDITPQLYIAPRGLITILLFYAIPEEAQIEGFDDAILLFVIISTALIMTFSLIAERNRANRAIRQANREPVGLEKWTAPTIEESDQDRG
ncbi:MAG: cation:proton antiporter [Bacteroidota bacterium]